MWCDSITFKTPARFDQTKCMVIIIRNIEGGRKQGNWRSSPFARNHPYHVRTDDWFGLIRRLTRATNTSRPKV